MKKLRAYRRFELEMTELTKFLDSAKFAFERVGALQEFTKNRKHMKYLEDNGLDTKRSRTCRFDRCSILILERMLTQQTMVRAISALEMFLIDTMRDIFIITKVPFKDTLKIYKFSQSQLLSITSTTELFNDIINRECRSLSSGGLSDIIKAYKRRLDIDLLHLPPGKHKLIEYHDIRHLIVHRLGRTDSQFRKKYNLPTKFGISMDREFLRECIDDINGFAEKTHDLVVNKLNELDTSSRQQTSAERQLRCKIEILEPDSDLEFLNADFEFLVHDEFEVLRNILLEKKALSENEFELALAGTNSQIRSYRSLLKYANQKQWIRLTIVEDVDGSKDVDQASQERKRYIDEDTIEMIRQQLPKQPWEVGIHKEVAEKLRLKKGVVYKAIKVLISRGIFEERI